ncbi:bZIP transcription factor [Thalictrum thalictroides]|uniref:BZIP transcription factor n=1 Tax=Thalictrum thalictroides TaxID=46969 RepID=A0A7J6VI88_THATH|nr:bZIP transcription factor [Thalictrum thalictroides]
MEEREDSRNDMLQRLQSSFGTSSSSKGLSINRFDVPHLNTLQNRGLMQQFSPNFNVDNNNNNKRLGIPPSYPQIPPISPYSQIPVPRSMVQQPVGQSQAQSFSPGPLHSRSLSQPAFFNLDSLPPLSPLPYRELSSTSVCDTVNADVSMEDQNGSLHTPPVSLLTRCNTVRGGDSLPPRKAHRRSNSDIPFGFSVAAQSLPPLVPPRSSSARENLATDKPIQLVKREPDWERNGENNAEGMGERKSEGEVTDDFFSAYMNLDNMDTLNSSATEGKNLKENREDLDSRASGTKTNGTDSSENEAESSVNESGSSLQQAKLNSLTGKREGIKRTAGGEILPSNRHSRSVSMDSFMGRLPNFADESPKLPPSPGSRSGQHSHSNSMDGTSTFSLDFGNGEFNGAELKKIMANEKLAEIALTDPKRVKRILANRQSAARSKERKMRYISELEHKVQTLQTEATTLSAQLTLLQRDSSGIANQNNELKFRLQAMEQQAHLRDALNEALTTEVQRLKLATAALSGEEQSTSYAQQQSKNSQMFQLQHQQLAKLNIYQLKEQQQQQQTSSQTQEQLQQPQQNNTSVTKHDSDQ